MNPSSKTPVIIKAICWSSILCSCLAALGGILKSLTTAQQTQTGWIPSSFSVFLQAFLPFFSWGTPAYGEPSKTLTSPS